MKYMRPWALGLPDYDILDLSFCQNGGCTMMHQNNRLNGNILFLVKTKEQKPMDLGCLLLLCETLTRGQETPPILGQLCRSGHRP